MIQNVPTWFYSVLFRLQILIKQWNDPCNHYLAPPTAWSRLAAEIIHNIIAHFDHPEFSIVKFQENVKDLSLISFFSWCSWQKTNTIMSEIDWTQRRFHSRKKWGRDNQWPISMLKVTVFKLQISECIFNFNKSLTKYLYYYSIQIPRSGE